MTVGRWYVQLAAIWHWYNLPLSINVIFEFLMCFCRSFKAKQKTIYEEEAEEKKKYKIFFLAVREMFLISEERYCLKRNVSVVKGMFFCGEMFLMSEECLLSEKCSCCQRNPSVVRPY